MVDILVVESGGGEFDGQMRQWRIKLMCGYIVLCAGVPWEYHFFPTNLPTKTNH